MIIGVSGKINSGKDLIGQIIQYLTDQYAKTDLLTFDQWLKECDGIEKGFNKNASPWQILQPNLLQTFQREPSLTFHVQSH